MRINDEPPRHSDHGASIEMTEGVKCFILTDQ